MLARTLHSLAQQNARGLSVADALDGFTVVGGVGTGLLQLHFFRRG